MKRVLDIGVSLTLLMLLAPLLGIVTILVRIMLGSPVIFKQPRTGLDEKIFVMYKFRTMTNAKNERGKLLSPADRLTPTGQFLREMSLDELPQLWNVLMGDMSLVGPRPMPVEYLPRYNSSQRRRHTVKPGITGWAQVNGRNAIGWAEKFALDVWYADNQSIALDLRILYATLLKVIRLKDVSPPNRVIMEEFTGTDDE